MNKITKRITTRLPTSVTVKQTEIESTLRNFIRFCRSESRFILAVFLLHSLLITGCVPQTDGVLGDRISTPEGDFYIDGIEIENARFELNGISNPQNPSMQMPLQPALAYWVREGDHVAAKWDTFEYHWEQEKNFCGFNDNTPVSQDEKCLVCNYCDPIYANGNYTGLPCLGAQPVLSGAQDFLVVADAGFIQTPNPETILSMVGIATNFLGGCNSSYAARDFAPQKSGLYRIFSPTTFITIRGEAKGEANIHVVTSGASMSQKAAYRLNRETIDGIDYWTWTVRGDDFWLENFSPNLRVTDIRILKGKCEPDPTSGKECVSPGEVVKPSRILFLPDFNNTVSGHPQESTNRCYAFPSQTLADGNYINLESCRNTYSTNPNLGTQPRIVTPTYNPDISSTPNNSLRKLTWLIQFDTGEGADANLSPDSPGFDPMPTNTELIIEFTIEAF